MKPFMLNVRRLVSTRPRLARLTSILLIVTAIASASRALAVEITLVEDGKAKAVIVIADSPSATARRAGSVLQEHIRAVSGAELRIVAERELGKVSVDDAQIKSAAVDAGAFVLVGESDLAHRLGVTSEALGAGGMRIRTFANSIVLLGPDDKTPTDNSGTLHAVLALLEERLGCWYLWPGPTGKVVPHRATIRIAEMTADFSPKILQRQIRDGAYSARLQVGLDRLGISAEAFHKQFRDARRATPADPEWFAWNRLGGTLGLRFGDAFGDWWQRFGKEHPDWFALQPNGSRDQSFVGNRCRLCESNPDLIEEIAREKIAELDRNPAVHSVSIGPNDGGLTTFCMCERCKRLDPPEGRRIELLYEDAGAKPRVRRTFQYVSLSDRMVHFYNAIAERVVKKHPEALLCADAYSVYSAPPIREKLHPSVVIRFVPMSYTNEDARQEALKDYRGWSVAASKIIYRPNFVLEGRRIGTAIAAPHRMAEDMKYLAGHGVVATDFDSCLNNWSVHGLTYFVLSRLLWDPDLDVDRLMDNYCRAGFGAGADPMKQYFLEIEKLTDQIAKEKLSMTAPYTPEKVASLRALLQEAGQMTANDLPSHRRVAFIQLGLEFTSLQARAYALLQQTPKPDPEAVRALLHERADFLKTTYREEMMALNAPYVIWGEGHPWAQLGWSWEKETGIPSGK